MTGSVMEHDTGRPAARPRLVRPPAPVAVLDAPVLVARDVAVGFGAKTVLSGIDLGFTPGTITALIGPTGCGKSTFLRSLNRMNDKVRGYWRTGAIEFDGQEIAEPPDGPVGAAPAGGHGLPAAQPLPHVGGRQRGGRGQGPPPGAAAGAAGRGRAVPARGGPVVGGGRPPRATRPSACRVASSNCSVWPGPWPSNPTSCCSTSRRRRSTRSPPRWSRTCCASWPPISPWSSSPTTWPRPGAWPGRPPFSTTVGWSRRGDTDAIFEAPSEPETVSYVSGRIG